MKHIYARVTLFLLYMASPFSVLSNENVTQNNELGENIIQASTEKEIWAFLKQITFQIYYDKHGIVGCTGFNLIQNKKDSVIWWMSAGHCANVRHVKLHTGHYVKTPIHFSFNNAPDDFLISTKPSPAFFDEPHVVWENSHILTSKGLYYTYGFNKWAFTLRGCLTILKYKGTNTNGYLLFERIWGCDLLQGMSGTPIINSKKELVGIYHGFSDKDGRGNPMLFYASDPRWFLQSLTKNRVFR